MKQIQWFPGHMTRTRREIGENLKLVDIVIELVDARVPISSQNPLIKNIVNQKPRLMILMKKDLADETLTKKWIAHFKENGVVAISLDVRKMTNKNILDGIKEVLKDKLKRNEERGLKKTSFKAMIVGIPNVGKSTFINQFVQRKVTTTGNKPGVTKKKQWIAINESLTLLDTPGILWPKFDDIEIGKRLALIGSIKDSVLPMHEIINYGLEFFYTKHLHNLEKAYGAFDMNIEGLYDAIRSRRGSDLEEENCVEIFLNDIRNGKLGRFTLDEPV